MDGNFGRGPASKPRSRRRWFRLKRPSPIVFMILSAALFLIGSASFNGHGSREMAEVGVVGAVLAVAAIAGLVI